MLLIREATESDLDALLAVEEEAFGEEEGPEIVKLVRGLLTDPTAQPVLSLIAGDGERVVGHILFTRARISAFEKTPAALLAPLAVVSDAQGTGVGGRLIAEGLRRLADAGVKLVFVLGHPGYYPRHGFKPAGAAGFEAPYPIPDEVAGAWMVREITPGTISAAKGKVQCADTLNRPEYWRE